MRAAFAVAQGRRESRERVRLVKQRLEGFARASSALHLVLPGEDLEALAHHAISIIEEARQHLESHCGRQRYACRHYACRHTLRQRALRAKHLLLVDVGQLAESFSPRGSGGCLRAFSMVFVGVVGAVRGCVTLRRGLLKTMDVEGAVTGIIGGRVGVD